MKFTAEQQAYLERVIDMEDLCITCVDDDISGNVYGDVDTVFGDVRGDAHGDVLGNVYGGVIGNVWGDVVGNVWGDVGGNVWGTVNGEDTV